MAAPIIQPDEVEWTAVRAQGAGGQNVNKVASAVHLRFDIAASSLPEPVKARLLALSDQGRPAFDPNLSAKVAALGAPVFACTPDQFPDLMATALRRQDVHAWAAKEDIKLVRAGE